MNRSRRRLMPLLLSLFLLLAAAGCSEDDPVKVNDDEGIEWPDLTGRDDVARTIVLCYENPGKSEALTRFEELLHSQYFFALDPRDVMPGGTQFLSQSEDIRVTQAIFENAILLDLTIYPEDGGSWQQITELNDEPCIGCWSGHRDYRILAQFDDEGTIYQSTPGEAAVTIVVAPDEGDPTKWVLRAIYDEHNN